MTYYKLITADNKSAHGGNFDWAPYLPHDGNPGDWTPTIEHPVVCERGYHVTDKYHLLEWGDSQLFEAEVDGIPMVDGDGKYCFRRIRLVRKIDGWNERTLRLFSCWCVRQVWGMLTDERSKNAVEVAERYANGGATVEELGAAWDTAWAAARYAAQSAAWDTAWAAARYAAQSAAWAAARAAARDAAWAAARDAAWAAQHAKLHEMIGLEVAE